MEHSAWWRRHRTPRACVEQHRRSIWILRFRLAAAFDDSDGIVGRDRRLVHPNRTPVVLTASCTPHHFAWAGQPIRVTPLRL